MAVYLRIEGLDREDLLDAETDHDESAVHDLADRTFDALRRDYPSLYDDLNGVVPVTRPEYDPRLLETTPVYVHRDATIDDGEFDHVDCSFDDDHIADLDAPRPHATDATDEVLMQLTQVFDDDRGRLDRDAWGSFVERLPTEAHRDEHDLPPVRAGTLYHDGTEVDRISHLPHPLG
jgi:hypothetical protein